MLFQNKLNNTNNAWYLCSSIVSKYSAYITINSTLLIVKYYHLLNNYFLMVHYYLWSANNVLGWG